MTILKNDWFSFTITSSVVMPQTFTHPFSCRYICIHHCTNRSVAPVDKSELKTCIQCALLSILHIVTSHCITRFLFQELLSIQIRSISIHHDLLQYIHYTHTYIPTYIWFNSLDDALYVKAFRNVQCCACVWCFVCLKNSMLYAWMSRARDFER